MSRNAFKALAGSSDESSDDEESSTKTRPQNATDYQVSSTLAQPAIESSAKRQAGGTLTMRVDPLVGLNGDKTFDLGFSSDDLAACVRVVELLGKNPALFKLSTLKPLRAALHPLIIEQLRTNYQVSEANSAGKNSKKRKRGKEKCEEDTDRERRIAELEAEYINQTQLRALRMQQLESLNGQGQEEEAVAAASNIMRIPDGAAIDTSVTSAGLSRPLLLQYEATADSANLELTDEAAKIADARADTARRLALLKGVTSTSGTALGGTGKESVPADEVLLSESISCYICRKPYRKLHFFYHQLCPECAVFNYTKRNEMCDMKGMVCLVTGARCKIGFRVALKLLRCGAQVIATTRFPQDAAKRYLAEQDSALWQGRLHVYGLDFRNLSALEAFCTYVINSYDRLDVIINNAAQTVRRPPAYYQHLLDGEKMLEFNVNSFSSSTSSSSSSTSTTSEAATTAAGKQDSDQAETKKEALKSILKHQYCFTSLLQQATSSMPLMLSAGGQQSGSDRAEHSTGSSGSSPNPVSMSTGSSSNVAVALQEGRLPPAMVSSAAMTQMQLAAGDDEVATATSTLFPLGATDVNGQQVDLRSHNSWTMRLHEVSTAELAEVFAINSMAPTIINARLKGIMERNKDGMKFIVNVSAMEGKFYRYKSDTHPHTNMAKAALNMMTRTSAQDYIKSNIYMTAVDTGWINDEKPIEKALNHNKKHNFQTPIDEIDAAARVCDPVIAPLLALQRGEAVEPPWGHFLKDYQKCEW